MSRYESLEDLSAKIENEGSDYFFTEYGFRATDLPEDAPAELVSSARVLEQATTAYREAKETFLDLLPEWDYR